MHQCARVSFNSKRFQPKHRHKQSKLEKSGWKYALQPHSYFVGNVKVITHSPFHIVTYNHKSGWYFHLEPKSKVIGITQCGARILYKLFMQI